MRFLPALTAIAIGLASLVHSTAYAQNAPTAKPAPKAAPKSSTKAAEPAPAPKKPKDKLMTRDELRACLARRDDHTERAKAVAEQDKQLNAERADLLKQRDVIKAEQDGVTAAEAALKAESEELKKRFEELKDLLPKMNKKEQADARADYEGKAAKVNAQIEPHNTRKRALVAAAQAFEQRADAFNKRKDELSATADKLGDEQDAWRTECGNKPYDEADEKALLKEKEAKAAAPAQ